jgi:hypothetical protein
LPLPIQVILLSLPIARVFPLGAASLRPDDPGRSVSARRLFLVVCHEDLLYVRNYTVVSKTYWNKFTGAHGAGPSRA